MRLPEMGAPSLRALTRALAAAALCAAAGASISAACRGQSPARTPPLVHASAAPAPAHAPPSAVSSVAPAPAHAPRRLLGAITALAFSPDGSRIALGAYRQVVVYDTKSWQQTAIFTHVTDCARSLAFTPDGKLLAVGSGEPTQSGTVVLWDATGAEPARVCARQADVVEAIAIRRDGDALLLGADDNHARYYPDIRSDFGAVLDEHNGRVQAVAFPPTDNQIFVTGGMDRIAKVWDMRYRHVVINFDQSEGGITGLAFLPNGVQFVGSSLDGKLYWWGVSHDTHRDVFSGYLFRTISAHKGGVTALAMSKDGNRIVTGGMDSAVRVWNGDGAKFCEFADSPQPIYAVGVSPDGAIAAAGGRDGLLRVWDVAAKRLIQTITPPALRGVN